MQNFLTIITILWTSFCLYYSKIIKKDHELFCYFLGIILVSAIAGTVIGIGSAKFMNVYFPLEQIDVNNLIETDLNDIKNLELQETNETLEDKELKEHQKKLKKWLLIAFIIYYLQAFI